MSAELKKTLLTQLLAYFGTIFVLVFLIVQFQPHWVPYLPIGGMSNVPGLDTMINDIGITQQVPDSGKANMAFMNALNLATALAGALLMALPLRWVYLASHAGHLTPADKKGHNPELATSLLVLPLVVTAIVYIVKFSLPLAFALAGIFAGVRYRTSLKSQADSFLTFASIGVGLAAGTQALGIAFILILFVSITVVLSTPARNFDD